MEIKQFRIVLRARSFDATCRFYGEVLALPRLRRWEGEEGCGALFQAGPGVVEVLGPPRDAGPGRLEAFDYQGPQHKLTITMVVPSAQAAYEELQFRDRNVPGGLSEDSGGHLVFETHDPDGVKIAYLEAGE